MNHVIFRTKAEKDYFLIKITYLGIYFRQGTKSVERTNSRTDRSEIAGCNELNSFSYLKDSNICKYRVSTQRQKNYKVSATVPRSIFSIFILVAHWGFSCDLYK